MADRRFLPDALALDRAAFASARRTDEDGHLHVTDVPISKANVCPYRGEEIPRWRELGLDRNKVYQLLRHPDELEKAAETFNGKPLLNLHKPQMAEAHDHKLTVGAVHNVHWKAPYLIAGDFDVWPILSIEGIVSGDQKEVSSGYRYDADMTRGTYEGVQYDGVMRNIRGNHIALVEAGRAGPDVVVGDEKMQTGFFTKEMQMPSSLSRKGALAKGALSVYLRPKLAQDTAIDFAPIIKKVDAKTFKPADVIAAVTAQTKGKLAADADVGDLAELVDEIKEHIDDLEDAEGTAAAPAQDEDDETAEERKDRMERRAAKKAEADKTAKDADPPKPGKDPEITKAAMDAAIARVAQDAAMQTAKAVKDAEANTIARLRGIAEAEKDVRPYIGELAIAQDSAEAVHKLALDLLKVDIEGVHPSAYRAILLAQPKPGDQRQAEPRVAMDAAGVKGFNERFPGASDIRIL